MKPHKHAELIKAWADGQIIQFKYFNDFEKEWGEWRDMRPDCGEFEDSQFAVYRIKPEPKPDPVKKTMYLYFVGTNEQKFWISDEPPETYLYRTISQYIGSIEVLK